MVFIKIIKTTMVILGLTIISCVGNKNSEPINKEGIEYTSDYICPMHCEGSGSDTAGLCPTCGMDYVLNED